MIRIGPNGCDSMEFHESGLLRFKQDSDMGIIHPLYKSTVGGRRNEDLVIVGENQPVSYFMTQNSGSTKNVKLIFFYFISKCTEFVFEDCVSARGYKTQY